MKTINQLVLFRLLARFGAFETELARMFPATTSPDCETTTRLSYKRKSPSLCCQSSSKRLHSSLAWANLHHCTAAKQPRETKSSPPEVT